MNKHTPGPWMANGKTIKTDLRPIGLGAEAGVLIGSVGGGESSGPSWPNSDDEVLANARLIAAAPDLLAFVEEFIEAWDNGMAGDSYLIRMAQKAYDKATGG